MKKKTLLFCLAFILVSLAWIYVSYRLNPPRYLELYDYKEGTECNIAYLKWHGRKTELEIQVMRDMRSGHNYYIIVEDGDTFTVEIKHYQNWAEFYVDDERIGFLYGAGHRSGEFSDY